ncbi:MAG: (d)CMP kinase [Puniceicoccales bacterium]|jgi:cytidylate kinase|nr:(d)CMP kinase [Puniceicoccales bacterium]
MSREFLLLLGLFFFTANQLCHGQAPDGFARFGSLQELLDAHQREFLEEKMQATPPQTQPRKEAFVLIAIDGGAGSGKTSTASAIAMRNNFAFVSTGEHYRVLARHLAGKNISPGNITALRRELDVLRPTTQFIGNHAHISLDGTVISAEKLHNGVINTIVADYAQSPPLREFLHTYQRQLPQVARAVGHGGIVIEGRDMTSVVFPMADLRIFLDADARARQRRRQMECIADDIHVRDAKDSKQLQRMDGVLYIDSTELSLEEVILTIQKEIQKNIRPT